MTKYFSCKKNDLPHVEEYFCLKKTTRRFGLKTVLNKSLARRILERNAQ